MNIRTNRQTVGSSTFSRNNDGSVDVELNIGDVFEELQAAYVSNAESMLSDTMTDSEIEYALSHSIWEKTCN